jgi:hypothetical protein
MPKESDLILIGYTNGDQIRYANEGESGLFFNGPENGCYIPVYMLKTHLHRIQSTSKTGFKCDMLNSIKV